MSNETFHSSINRPLKPDEAHFRLASQAITTTIPLVGIESFRSSLGTNEGAIIVEEACRTVPVQQPIYSGEGWVANAWRQVTAGRCEGYYQIEISDVGEFFVADNGSRIEAGRLHAGLDRTILTETLLGPALMLAFALRGSWSLHASAAMLDDKLIAFVGESGNGKSTLAGFLDSHPGWRRVVDDILPVVQTETDIDVLPHFPQLKIASDRQPCMGLPEHIPLHALYVIKKPKDSVERIESTSLSAIEAMAAIIRHTVASRLFDSKLLSGQLDFAQYAAATVPIRQLEYPRRHELLPMIADKLAEDLT